MRKRLNKYALIVEDEFGFKKIKYYICTKKQIERLLFKKYINLRQKAIAEDEYSIFSNFKKQAETIIPKKKYTVRLDVGFKLFHNIYYCELNKKDTYAVTKTSMEGSFILGYFDRVCASKKARYEIQKEFVNKRAESKIIKEFTKGRIKYYFDFWFKCSYEYDEYDESSIACTVEKIKFHKK